MENELENIILDNMDRIYRYMYSRCRDEYKAEDLTQDTILTAYKAYPELRDKTKVVPWLWGIANNIYARSLKRNLQNREEPMDEITITTLAGVSFEQPEEEYIRKSESEKIRRAVSYLAKNYRDVCVMYWLEEKSYGTISEELGIPLSSVKWRLNQSKIQLKKEYEKMEYMEKGYRRAVDLTVSVAGWEMGGESFKAIEDTMKSLLAKNICLSAYKKPKTVTEIAAELGVSADYIEYELERLMKTSAVKKTADKYVTMFPIWNKNENADIWGGNYDLALSEADKIIDMALERMDMIKSVGFVGSDKTAEELILFVLGYLCINIPENNFPSDLLPFEGINKKWYILATDEKSFESRSSSAGVCAIIYPECEEYCFVSNKIDDGRTMSSDSLLAFNKLYRGENDAEEYRIAELIENGEIKKDGQRFIPAVPVLDKRKGECEKLDKILSPAFEYAAEVQKKLLKRSNEAVRRHMPAQIQYQAEFFGAFCTCQALENAFIEILIRRGLKLDRDMTSWFVIK